MGIKTLLHESNSMPGLSSKKLSKFVDIVCADNADALAAMPKAKRGIVTGCPLLKDVSALKDKQSALKSLGLKDGFTILSFGGSLGSEAITQAVAEVVKWENTQGNINHIHSYGRMCDDEFRWYLQSANATATEGRTLFASYFYNMYDCYAAADLVISRAGAMTLAELKNFGKPSVLIPWSGAAGNHQYYNALTMKNSDAAEMLTDTDLTPTALLDIIKRLHAAPDQLVTMGGNAKKQAIPDSAGKIVALLIE
jgi:UDP-N-acetylglucosamine--N-acetylmuramyl-(pentapeptide) pyrophosphoryl-undecaprenol N-acetylglucosamine transferase